MGLGKIEYKDDSTHNEQSGFAHSVYRSSASRLSPIMLSFQTLTRALFSNCPDFEKQRISPFYTTKSAALLSFLFRKMIVIGADKCIPVLETADFQLIGKPKDNSFPKQLME